MARGKRQDQVVVEEVEEVVDGPALEESGDVGYDDSLVDEQGRELLFAGGPTLDTVEEWKSLYGEIYLTEFEGDELIIWRGLKRAEYKQIMKTPNADQYYKEERICEKCVLWPEKYGFQAMSSGKAGVPTLIAELVMEKSGFQPKTGAMRL